MNSTLDIRHSLRRVLVLCGPTGVGKTEIAVELAREFKLEIVSAG